MPKKQGLGRGLDSIFIDNSQESSERVTTLRLSELEPRRGQPRKNFDTEALSQLADSIAANGLIQPIIVRAVEGSDFYQIIAGERRFRAAKMAGLNEVPVVVLEADDQKAAEYALIENIQREDLNPIEEAQGFRSLIDDYHLTQEKAAAQVGRSRASVTNSLRLLELPDPVLSMVSDGSLSAGHARALLGLNDKSRIEEIASLTASRELSVRAVEELVRKANQLSAAEEPEGDDNAVENNYYTSLEEKLGETMGCKIRISHSKRSRTLSISYRDTDELEKLIGRLIGQEDAEKLLHSSL